MYKILIVSRSFYPVISPRSFRATELAKELARKGNEVTVYTIKDEKIHNEFEVQYNLKIKDLGKLKYKPFGKSNNRIISIFKRVSTRLLQQLFEYPSIELMGKVKKAVEKEKGYDLIISIAVPYPIHWGVAAAIKKSHKPAKVWVADCGDPYMGDISDSFKKLFYFKYVEKWFFKKADYITIPIENAKKGYYPEFHDKIVVIPQGFDFSNIQKVNYQPHSIPTFIYAGGFIPGFRDPVPFLKELEKLNKPFKFIIYTKNVSIVKPFKDKLGDKLEIRDYVDRDSLLTILSQADFLVSFSNADVVQSPSKLIDYKISDRPILNVEYGKVDRELIEEFFAGNYRRAYQIENIEDYNIKNVAQKFINLLN